MLTFAKARRIAEAWVTIMTDGGAELVREAVQAKPYGWVFFYQSSAFLRDPNDLSAALAGNVPFLVERTNGELRVLGMHHERWLTDYERTLPDARVRAKPELPRW